MKVGIRADGGPSIGFGHLIRTSAVAAECKRQGDSVIYFTTTPEAVSTMLPEFIEVKPLDTTNDPTEISRVLDDCAIDILFLDLFEADTPYQQVLAESDSRLVVRHNYQNFTVCCDVLVYGDLHAPSIDYEWIGTKPEFLIGPDYILLREQFRKVAKKKPKWRPNINRALITMGGSDIANTTPTAMDAFRHFNGTVDVIIGPGFSNSDEIIQRAESLETQFNLIHSPDDMANLMERADIAVSAVGGTVFELLATRTPFIGVPQAENQMQRAEALRLHELARIVTTADDLKTEVDTMLEDNNIRRELFERMAGVVDGEGAKRIYEHMH